MMNDAFIDADFDFGQKEEIDRLARSVQRRLSGRVLNFRLLVLSDGLVLKGEAMSFHAKQLAQHVIMKTTRWPILANEIEVGVVCAEAQQA